MSVVQFVTGYTKASVLDTISFLRMTVKLLIKAKLIENAFMEVHMSIMNYATINKKLKAAKNHVAYMNYRLNKMEEVIEGNNPHNLSGGYYINRIQ